MVELVDDGFMSIEELSDRPKNGLGVSVRLQLSDSNRDSVVRPLSVRRLLRKR